MESLFGVIKYLFLGFFGILALIFIAAIIFGRRIIRKWEYVAEFRDTNGIKYGEVELKMSRIEKEEPDFSMKVDFWCRHEALKTHQTVRVYLDELLLLEGMVKDTGRIRLGNDHLQAEIDEPTSGEICKLECDGTPFGYAELVPD